MTKSRTIVLLLAAVIVSPTAASRSARARSVIARCPSGGSVTLFAVPRGATSLSLSTVPVCLTGKLTVEFHGDPGSGCTAHGLCGYQGTDLWWADRPSPPRTLVLPATGELDVLEYRHRGKLVQSASLSFRDQPVTAQVARVGSQTGCSDTIGVGPVYGSADITRGVLSVGVASSRPWIGTRCAGPLDGDLTGALPVGRIALNTARRGHATVDLSSTRAFAANGFAGTVTSTLMLTLGNGTTGPPLAGNSGGSHGRTVLMRVVTVSYRVTRVSGTARVHVLGADTGDVCGPLDACGTSGTIRVAPRFGRGEQSFIDATGPARRPYRDFLAALGLSRAGNPRGIFVGSIIRWHDAGTITADTQQPSPCQDAVRLTTSDLGLSVSGRAVSLQYHPIAQSFDPLRTRCPGPTVGQTALATGRTPLATLARPKFTLTLDKGTTQHTGPYRLSTISRISITLQRTRISQTTYQEIGG